MKKLLILVLSIVLAPALAVAMSSVGDVAGANPSDATAALAAAVCSVDEFEAADGRIEGKCHALR